MPRRRVTARCLSERGGAVCDGAVSLRARGCLRCVSCRGVNKKAGPYFTPIGSLVSNAHTECH